MRGVPPAEHDCEERMHTFSAGSERICREIKSSSAKTMLPHQIGTPHVYVCTCICMLMYVYVNVAASNRHATPHSAHRQQRSNPQHMAQPCASWRPPMRLSLPSRSLQQARGILPARWTSSSATAAGGPQRFCTTSASREGWTFPGVHPGVCLLLQYPGNTWVLQ
jgi:hypothetical protein